MNETERAPQQLEQRLLLRIPLLERQLRKKAVEAVSQRAYVLTDGQLEADDALILALARAARACWTEAVKAGEQVSPHLDLDGTGNADTGRQSQRVAQLIRTRADRIDETLVALAAASDLIHGTSKKSSKLDIAGLLELCLTLLDVEVYELIRERAAELALATLIRAPAAERLMLLGIPPLQVLRSYAEGRGASRFVQSTLLELLAELTPLEFPELYVRVLKQCHGPDSMVPRRRAVLLIPSIPLPLAKTRELLELALRDPSEHVRQGLAQAATSWGALAGFRLAEQLVQSDESPRVRGQALLELARSASDRPALEIFASALRYAAQGEPLLMQCALEAVRRISPVLLANTAPDGELARQPSVLPRVLRELQGLATQPQLDIAEEAALLLRTLETESNPLWQRTAAELRGRIVECSEGGEIDVQPRAGIPPRAMERIIYSLVGSGLPASLRTLRNGSLRIRVGERRAYAGWRLLYELLHPAADKRQGFLHSTSRHTPEMTQCVPLRMAEVTETKVPGERRTLNGQSWGTLLPRIDDLLMTCRSGSRRLLTPFGVLELEAPRSWLKRFWLRIRLSVRYAQWDKLRSQSLTDKQRKTQYCGSMRRLGFTLRAQDTEVEIDGVRYQTLNATHESWFATLPVPVSLWSEEFLQYVLAPSGNSAWHLGLVTWLLLSFMLLRASRVRKRFTQAKRRIPLSIGGWGSRGKSGTERLKAGLFHAAHYDVVSKTTGCEAMLIVAQRGQSASEVFLYRPYDKATIWEQETAVEYAEQLHAQVFLWECMALKPEFVDILNADWMRDRLTTITNAYPDHEDIMGPSGEDVARTVSSFMPTNGHVLTTEHQMLPLLASAATKKGTQLRALSPLEGALLPADLLARFPYQEHPSNIALVMAMAEHYGIQPERALLDMADAVVPDLGVLKTFPKVAYRGRTLRFSNGMSANERAGFLSNWERLGYAKLTPETEPTTLIVAVINNRADRPARTRVFAQLFARDVVVDRMVVIGTNQKGFCKGFRQAMAQWLKEHPLQGTGAERVHELQAQLDRLRLNPRAATLRPLLQQLFSEMSQSTYEGPLEKLLQSVPQLQLGELKEETLGALREHWNNLPKLPPPAQSRLAALRRQLWSLWQLRLAAENPVIDLASLNQRRLGCFLELMCARLHPLDDSNASGDQVLDFTMAQVPTGCHAELLGCQNIKGTGLDFIYRFISLDRVAHLIEDLRRVPERRENGLLQLGEHPDYGLVDLLYAAQELETIENAQEQSWSTWQPRVARLRAQLQQRAARRQAALAARSKSSRLTRALGFIEPWFDHWDAVRRRKRADGIMRDLTRGSRSLPDAARALREVTGRQKGGWLIQDLQRLGQRARKRT